MARVLGADAAGRLGWVGVVVDDDGFVAAHVAPTLQELIDAAGPCSHIGVDIPIGNLPGGTRSAEAALRPFVGGRASSVFTPVPEEVLHCATYAEARKRLAAGKFERSVSAQAWNLVPKMLEAREMIAAGTALYEVHPEASFRAMAGAPLAPAKKSWNGARRRTALLEHQGIGLPDHLGDAGRAPVDDVLDAAAVAWSAQRIARGRHRTFPDPPETDEAGRPVAIWC